MLGIVPVSLWVAKQSATMYHDLENPPVITRAVLALAGSVIGHPTMMIVLCGVVAAFVVWPHRLTA